MLAGFLPPGRDARMSMPRVFRSVTAAIKPWRDSSAATKYSPEMPVDIVLSLSSCDLIGSELTAIQFGYCNVCTSTESTAGRSRTIGAHESPASAEPYTCPPLVPKYTPHL